MNDQAKGKFEIDFKPQTQDKIGEITLGRYSITKQFSGDLDATSRVDMLAAGVDNGAGAYVAIELVTGKLKGRSGAFVLMHSGTRTADTNQLSVSVVPGCATGELAGIVGQMKIDIDDEDRHFYDFDYSFK